ncbi:ABC transporter permease [Desulfovibrio inopinatus]|uniref:ABC transporter permease n=1 Tax=Desulfovibrio inopinatus TaxID=102109 RepID=UPI00041596A4|nr:ABC transporter permease [Desulfovibrio inopinatus]
MFQRFFTGLVLARSSLVTHKLRTVLAMLGVFLGAFALIGVQHISLAMMAKAEQETAKLGVNLMGAVAGQIRFRRNGSATGSGRDKTFTLADATALSNGLPQVSAAAPFFNKTTSVRFAGIKVSCLLIGTNAQYPEVRNAQPEFGRFFSPMEYNRKSMVCVLGRTIANKLFGSPRAALGQRIFLYRAGLRVIGVMEEKGSDFTGSDQDEQIFVPLTTYMRRLANVDFITGVYLQLRDSASFAQAKQDAEKILRVRHQIPLNGKDDFSVLTAQDAIRVQTEALGLVETLGVISSSLSFAVGGLGILSIMILLVRSRRLEIGVRRAVGARRRDIIRQFLLESGIMAVFGGAAGVLAALVLLSIVYPLAGFPPVYQIDQILGALVGSAALGLVAGAYPAWVAARVEILDVLRNG